MSNLLMFGQCCTLLSAWGVVQLTIMGLFYVMEPVTLFTEAKPNDSQFSNYDEFKTVTKEGYYSVAMNCFLAAGMYLITFFCSLATMKKAKRDDAKALLESEQDDFELKPKTRYRQQSLDMDQPLPKKAALYKTA